MKSFSNRPHSKLSLPPWPAHLCFCCARPVKSSQPRKDRLQVRCATHQLLENPSSPGSFKCNAPTAPKSTHAMRAYGRCRLIPIPRQLHSPLRGIEAPGVIASGLFTASCTSLSLLQEAETYANARNNAKSERYYQQV